MIIFLLKRLGWLILTLWVVFTLSFILMYSVPGGPYSEERNLTPEIEANIKAQYNLDDPLHKQYFDRLAAIVFRFDFGPSWKLEDYTVNEVISQGFPVSASLGILALVLALAVGTAAGVVSAVRQNSVFDYGLMALATLGIALPNFVLASLAVILFVFVICIFPAAGWGTIQQLILPALCLAAPFAAYISRLTRTGMLEVLHQDYIRTAWAKGLSQRSIVVRHALRGAMLPVVSYLGPATAGILTGSLVLERIFVIPGMGSHFVEAAFQRDYTLAMGVVLVYTFLLFLMNLLVDVSYAIIDPRVRIE